MVNDLVTDEPRRAWLGAEAHVTRPRGFRWQQRPAPGSKAAVVLAALIGAALGAGITVLFSRLSRRNPIR